MGSIDATELSRWFDAYGPALVLYGRQWLGRCLVEDVVQDVFLRLMSQRTAPSNVKAWLFRSVRNAAISELRSQRRRRTYEHRASVDRGGWFEHRQEDPIEAEIAEDALALLSDEQREVIVLRIWGGMTFQEISEISSQPVSTLFSRYKTGLGTIRRKLELSCKSKMD